MYGSVGCHRVRCDGAWWQPEFAQGGEGGGAFGGDLPYARGLGWPAAVYTPLESMALGGDAAGQGVRPRDTGTGERSGLRGHGWDGISTGMAVRASGRASRTGGV